MGLCDRRRGWGVRLLSPVGVRAAGEIERAITAFARASDGGLIVTGSTGAVVHCDLIIALAARHKLPAVYYQRLFVTAGGLMSYGANYPDLYWRAAGYVDRILKALSRPTYRYRHQQNTS
jgi:putative ABC transport system substrate-binding protein